MPMSLAMCGRFKLTADGRAVADRFGLLAAPDLSPRFNIAPTQPVLAVRPGAAGREAAILRWGLVPAWARDASAAGLINARCETVADKPAFRGAFRKRRCLVPADGFFEWRAGPGRKQPFLFRSPDGGPFAIAGLWEGETCALLTTPANVVVRPVHDRMPVLLSPGDFDLWLNPASVPVQLLPLLRPASDDALTAMAVRPFVNDARHEGPGCVELLCEPSLFDRLLG
jgi:putative SOS response-associated peptidase YedK